ncbi:MAG: uracil-DNA glycosylase family protein [Acidobacteriota bacterium]
MTSDQTNELGELLKQTREYVHYFGELGAETIGDESVEPARTTLNASSTQTEPPRTVKPAATITTPQAEKSIRLNQPLKPAALSTAPQDGLFGGASPAPTLPPSTETLEDIWLEIGNCTRCALCSGRTQVVNTHGNPKARLMFVGEAPGADEDVQGKPFVGRAGQLLTKMIEAMGLKREEVIIGNVNRCRPPGNRQPTLEEAAICRPFLFREIAVVRPEVIVVMGNTALRNLLEVKAGISSVRGQFRDYQGIKVMPTFHPAYLLRDPSKKRETWDDLKKVMEYLDGNSDKAASG